MIDAITICINYSDYLIHTIENNRRCFDRWLIVTDQSDEATISLCKSAHLEYVISDRVRENGHFRKGCGINDGLVYLNPRDWIVQLDADTLLNPLEFKKSVCLGLDRDKFYGLIGRYTVASVEELKELCRKENISRGNLEHAGLFVGYFQMWHSSMRALYPEESLTAGLDDVLMRDSYHRNNWATLKTYGVHLGPMWVNHKGRVSGKFV